MDLSGIEVGFEYGESDTAVRKEIVRNVHRSEERRVGKECGS